jgi:two-component system, OmpR family, response regulator TctD
MRILIVEDIHELSDWLAKLLRHEHYTVDCLFNGEDALHALTLHSYDLGIIDLGLPKMSGIELIRSVRNKGLSMPILILTADGGLQSRVSGLDAGADDYLAKPFDVAEFEARIRALLRRSGTTVKSCIELGTLKFNIDAHSFSINDVQLNLSPREHAVLECLIRRAGLTVSKPVLLDSIYGFEDEASLAAIEIYVHRLRKKLESSSVAITTLRGFGYLLHENK